MALWKQKKDKKPLPMRQIRQMVEEEVGLEFIILDDEGETKSTGRCKIYDYQREDHFFIIDVPTDQGKNLQVLEEEPVRVLFDLGGVSFMFDTKVVESLIHEPEGGASFAALKINAPKHLESGTLRKYFRVEPLRTSMPEINWRPVMQESAAEEEIPWVKANLRDVSGRGLGLLMTPKETEKFHSIHNRKIWPPLAMDIPPEKVEELRVHTAMEISVLLPESDKKDVVSVEKDEKDKEEGGRKPIVIKSFVRQIFDLPGASHKERCVGVEFDLPADTTHQEIMDFALECQREIARRRSDSLNP